MHAHPNKPLAPVLLIGGSGMLGRAWRELLTTQHLDFAAPAHVDLDLTNPRQIAAHLHDRFRLVVNCAAWTDVDAAEAHPEQAAALNARAPEFLAQACAKTGATLVHYSTDYVFNGNASHPYPVDAPRDPQNAYGRSKADGEKMIAASACKYLVIRTSWLYAAWGKNFVRTILRAARKNPDLRVVDDQRGRPTSSRHLAQATLDLLHANASGFHHAADAGECTWFDFAREIVRLTHLPCKVLPCTTADFPRPAKRPAYSVLDLAATEKLIGPMPPWQTNLAHVIAHMEPLES